MSPKRDNTIWKGIACALVAVVLWSLNFIIARGIYQKITPISLAFLRWTLATLLLTPFAVKSVRENRNILIKHKLHLGLTALTGITLFNTFIYIAGRHTTAINLALIGTTASPLFVLLISGFILKEKFSLFQIGGAILCIAGIIYLVTKGDFAHLRSIQLSQGDLWVFLAGLFFAIYTILVRRRPKEIAPIAYLYALFFMGTLLLLPAFITDRIYAPAIDWDSTIILSIIYLAIAASVIAFLLWNKFIYYIGAPRTALFGNLIPILSATEAILLLHEAYTPILLMSMFLILAGLTLANWKFIVSQ